MYATEIEEEQEVQQEVDEYSKTEDSEDVNETEDQGSTQHEDESSSKPHTDNWGRTLTPYQQVLVMDEVVSTVGRLVELYTNLIWNGLISLLAYTARIMNISPTLSASDVQDRKAGLRYLSDSKDKIFYYSVLICLRNWPTIEWSSSSRILDRKQ
ncbi:hypothetical protein BGX28_010112 [Mortierella sp. GBA30]|nr:hypothetical protein BGX28_010112 [Mortierella sp. GBA30]